MEILKKIFPLSFKMMGNIYDFVIGILIYVAAALVGIDSGAGAVKRRFLSGGVTARLDLDKQQKLFVFGDQIQLIFAVMQISFYNAVAVPF